MADNSGSASFSINPRLSAVIAALREMDASLQGPALKQYLEYGLERLQAIEQAHYEFLGECAMLAADNIQDVRLQDLERRVGALESQDKPWGETLADIALNIAIQIAVLATLEAAAALVIAAAGQTALRSAVRSASQSIASSGTTEPLVNDLVVRLEGDRQHVQKLIDKMLSLKGSSAIQGSQITYNVKISASETRTINTKKTKDWLDAIEELVRERENLNDKLRLAQQSHKNAEKMERVIKAYDEALNSTNESEIDAYWKNWRGFIGGERGDLLMSPVQTIFEKVNKSMQNAAGDSQGGQLFLSSAITGRFLTWASNERLRIADEYSNLRLYVRYANDSDVKNGTEPIMVLAELISENLPKWERLRLAAQAARPWLVSGFEATFWREYFLSNGMLDVKYDVRYKRALGSIFGIGSIIDGYLIKKPPQGLNTDLYTADYYYGVTKLTELQADYLFHRFAKRYFDTAKDAPHLYFEYNPDNYKDVVSKEVFGLVPQNKRTRRINEMRLMVILYFLNLNPGETDQRLDAILEEGSSIGINEALSSDMGIAPEPMSVEEENKNIIETANLLQFVLELADRKGTQQLQIQQLAFANIITDLNMDIFNYNMLKSNNTEIFINPGDKTLEEVEREIEDEQLNMKVAYEDLKNLAKDNPDALKTITDVYEKTVEDLFNWTAEASGTFPWRWYGPESLIEE